MAHASACSRERTATAQPTGCGGARPMPRSRSRRCLIAVKFVRLARHRLGRAAVEPGRLAARCRRLGRQSVRGAARADPGRPRAPLRPRQGRAAGRARAIGLSSSAARCCCWPRRCAGWSAPEPVANPPAGIAVMVFSIVVDDRAGRSISAMSSREPGRWRSAPTNCTTAATSILNGSVIAALVLGSALASRRSSTRCSAARSGFGSSTARCGWRACR